MNNDAFTSSERKAWEALGEAVKHFKKLQMSHPSHEKDFCDGIHQAQNILCQRVMQREHPELVATYVDRRAQGGGWCNYPYYAVKNPNSKVDICCVPTPNPLYE